MQKINYQKLLDDEIQKISEGRGIAQGAKPSLLLHACCGPCSSYVLEYLARYFDITVFYYNPNIYPPEEYNRRLQELKNLYTRFPPAIENNVKLVEAEYIPEDFYTAVGTREQPELAAEAEKGERCRRCYHFRLEKSFQYACKNHFDYFCTTLSISPFKDSEKINAEGAALYQQQQQAQSPQTSQPTQTPQPHLPKWLYSDFKKKGGFKRSLELSQEYKLYRQQYCGCVYSYQGNRILSSPSP